MNPPDPAVFAANAIRIYSDELAKRGVREDVLIAALEATGARASEFWPQSGDFRPQAVGTALRSSFPG